MQLYQPSEECGVFGIYNQPDAAAYTALGLHALQHRGQEAAGIVTFDGEHFHSHRVMGLVGDNFGTEEIMRELVGSTAIGHVRYSTTGETALRNVQPLFAHYEFGGMAIAHNGNLTNANIIRHDLVKRGCIFQSSSDTEVIIHLVATNNKENLIDRLIDSLKMIEGAYSIVAMTNRRLIGVRDPNGVRPLAIGKLGESYIIASESTAFDINGAEFVREVEPGEIVWIDKFGLHSLKPFEKAPSKFCIFEYVYFSRPDSVVEGRSVYAIRKQIGVELARENGVEADVVVPVPDSGVPSAIGYAQASGIPYDMGIIRNHYVGRTFIQPTDKIRHLGVKLKHLTCRATVEGKRVILVDDSIVRGTTSKKIVDMIRAAGAKEVHFRVASPPTTDPCFYGIDTPDKKSLVASEHNVEQIAKIIGVDSLKFITIDGLYRAVGETVRNGLAPQFCDACFTGEYPIDLKDQKGLKNVIDFSLLKDHNNHLGKTK